MQVGQVKHLVYIRSEKPGSRAALGAVFHRLDFNLSSLQFCWRNVLVLRELAALGVFCIIYVPMVHAQEPHPQPASRGLHRSR